MRTPTRIVTPTRGAPQIRSITALGVGTAGNNPQTGSVVRLQAVIDVPTGYQLTACSWTGNITPGQGAIGNSCRYEYTPSTGDGPAVATYGAKNVSLMVSYRRIDTGQTGQTWKSATYKVFFNKSSDDDGDGNPNWYEYWGDDGAVPGLKDSNVLYDPTLGSSSWGYWSPSDDKIHIGGAASEIHYPSGINVPATTICPGGSFGGARGIDCASEVVEHEGRHKWIYHNWDSGGIWNGMTDSDRGKPSLDYNDRLPDSYEISTTHTATNTIDSCNLATYKSATYKYYGDNEWAVMTYSNGRTGTASNDWANPGKQSAPPFAVIAQAGSLTLEPGGPGGQAMPRSPSTAPVSLANEIAQLTGAYSDSGVDADGDGRFDSLRLSVGVQITETELYNVVAWLESGAGNQITWANKQQTLSAGTHTVELSFSGLAIRNAGLDGPYNIARVELRVSDAEMLTDTSEDPHVTAAYRYTDFAVPDVALAGSYSDAGVDTSGDGLYDVLRIAATLDANRGGAYTVVGELLGTDPIAVARATVVLSVGRQAVNLDFDGRLIFQARHDGSYYLRAVRIEDASGHRIEFRYDAYTTNAYLHTQFQHEGTAIDAASYSDQGVDSDADGDFDYLRVEFRVDASSADSYRLLATLSTQDGAPIAQVTQDLSLTVGSNQMRVDFPGTAINAMQVNGPYKMTSVTLWDASGTIVDYRQVAHTTRAYGYTDFAPQPVSLTSTYQDRGRDADGDGLYDSLDVDVGVNVGEIGVIIAGGRLADGRGRTIEWAEANAELSAANALSITLSFNGRLIFINGSDGPFEVRDLIVYHAAYPEQPASPIHVYSTTSYTYLSFEGPEMYLPLICSQR